jgi:hypothetical protein
MILRIFGIYALITAKLQISRHYGLKGKAARIAGVVCTVFGLGFFTLLSIPVFATTRAIGLPGGGAAAINLVLQVAVLAATSSFSFASMATLSLERHQTSNQSVKPTAPLAMQLRVFATTPCRGFISFSLDRSTPLPMSDATDQMKKSRKEVVVPYLRERGFTGSFPHLRRREPTELT